MEEYKPIPDKAKELLPGLHFWHNPGNDFSVLRVHYTSDPNKRDPRWADTIRRKVGDVGFRVHYEIDFMAMGGQKVFPELAELWKHIEFEPFPIPEHWVRLVGMDWGINHPAAMLQAALDTRGELWIYWEFKQPNILVDKMADILADRPDIERVNYGICDVAMMKRDQSTKSGNISILNLLMKRLQERSVSLPIHWGSKHDDIAVERIRELFWEAPEIPPRIHVSSECPMLKQELFNLQFKKLSEQELRTNKPSPKLVQKNNDLFDCLKYILLSHAPSARPPDKREQQIQSIPDQFTRDFWKQWGPQTQDEEVVFLSRYGASRE